MAVSRQREPALKGQAHMKAKAHGLFPNEVGKPPAEVSAITILRLGDAGRMSTYQEPLSGEEMQNEQQLYALVGGGTYDVVARDSNGQISARHRYTFEGAPKPFSQALPVATVQQPLQQHPAQS